MKIWLKGPIVESLEQKDDSMKLFKLKYSAKLLVCYWKHFDDTCTLTYISIGIISKKNEIEFKKVQLEKWCNLLEMKRSCWSRNYFIIWFISSCSLQLDIYGKFWNFIKVKSYNLQFYSLKEIFLKKNLRSFIKTSWGWLRDVILN